MFHETIRLATWPSLWIAKYEHTVCYFHTSVQSSSVCTVYTVCTHTVCRLHFSDAIASLAPTMVSLLDRHSHNSNEDETHLQTKRTNLVHLAIIIRIVDVSPKSGPLAVHVVAGIIMSPFISQSPNKIGACSANLVDVLPKSGGLQLVRMFWRV